jgi:hypothetical protein
MIRTAAQRKPGCLPTSGTEVHCHSGLTGLLWMVKVPPTLKVSLSTCMPWIWGDSWLPKESLCR